MQHIAKMPRLTKLAQRNRNRGLNVLFTTGLLVTSTVSALALVVALTTGL